ncbi:Toxin [Caenorhabditis elegans]|uniref:Toxin n=1 Tax=Caenorhabditis elegans TaxID=6239 RepID=A5Z2V2_CAEEL|nr:Toxin [Caenorhabditis elegans]CAN99656.1 Toxin [Caenorhabditis elegans]|eukprot:NP_001122578.1 Uncharacterized protein CELE_C04H5.7 [Caenorhabditis elegans]
MKLFIFVLLFLLTINVLAESHESHENSGRVSVMSSEKLWTGFGFSCDDHQCKSDCTDKMSPLTSFFAIWSCERTWILWHNCWCKYPNVAVKLPKFLQN